MTFLFAVLRLLGIILVAHALMLMGADEISSLEMGGVRYIRSLDSILTLYGADPKPFVMMLPEGPQGAFLALMALPGWAVLAVTGGLLSFFFQSRN